MARAFRLRRWMARWCISPILNRLIFTMRVTAARCCFGSRSLLKLVSGGPDLEAAFGVGRSTVQRSVNRLRRVGEASFLAPRRGRGPSVLDAEMVAEANRLLASGLSGAAVCATAGGCDGDAELQPSQGLCRERFCLRRRGSGLRLQARSRRWLRIRLCRKRRRRRRSNRQVAVDRGARDARDRDAPMGRGRAGHGGSDPGVDGRSDADAAAVWGTASGGCRRRCAGRAADAAEGGAAEPGAGVPFAAEGGITG